MRDADNPYAGPDAAIEEQVEPAIHWTPAGKWRRFINWLIDRSAFDLEAAGAQTLRNYLRGLGLEDALA